MAEDWLEHTVQVEVPIGIERVWELWASLELMPHWMKWIRSVELIDDEISKWTLDARGFNFSWTSRITTLIKHQIISWKSVDGLANRGTLRFYDRKGSTIVKLSVAYVLPGILGKIMDGLFLGKIVESSLQEDLERFRTYALDQTRSV
ncbi:MAG: SRPBCC family protein [Cyanobacteriota bacterium]|nr:SRPBCC family protein [Cyanobacteriota bacterium]